MSQAIDMKHIQLSSTSRVSNLKALSLNTGADFSDSFTFTATTNSTIQEQIPNKDNSNISYKSLISRDTLTSNKILLEDNESHKLFGIIGDYEVKFNNLLCFSEQKERKHFSVVNGNIKSLLMKTLSKRESNILLERNMCPSNRSFIEKVPMGDIKELFHTQLINSEFLKSPHKMDENQRFFVNNGDLLMTEDSESDQCSEKSPKQPTQHIPPKFRNKKLPYLDKQSKLGFIKFFDLKNNFGFMTLLSEPYGDVFIFGKEFAKSRIGSDLISMASGKPDIILRFKVMYYQGKHGESKKAVGIAFS